jgi:hypothetical protein
MVKTGADHVKAEASANFRRPPNTAISPNAPSGRLERKLDIPSDQTLAAKIPKLSEQRNNSVEQGKSSARTGSRPTVLKVIREPPGNPAALYPIGTIRNLDLVAKSGQCRIVMPRLRSREWCPYPCSWTLLVTLGPDRVPGCMVKNGADRIKAMYPGRRPATWASLPRATTQARRRFTHAIKAYWASPCSMSWIHAHRLKDAGEKPDDRGRLG